MLGASPAAACPGAKGRPVLQRRAGVSVLPLRLPAAQVALKVRRRSWLMGRVIEDVTTEADEEVEEAEEGEEGDDAGEWEPEAPEGDVRRGGLGRAVAGARRACWGTLRTGHAAHAGPAAQQQVDAGVVAAWQCEGPLPCPAPTALLPPPPFRLQPLAGGLAGRAEAEEEDSLFDDDVPTSDDVQAAAAALSHLLSTSPSYVSAQAGPREAAAMLLAAVAELGVQPSEADLAAVAAWVGGAGAADAAVALVAALDQQPQPVPGTAALRTQLAEVYASRAPAEGAEGLEAAVAELLPPSVADEDVDAAQIERELADWVGA